MHRRNRRLACFSTVCCFLTIGIVLAAIGVTAGGAYMALNRYLLLSAERAATLNGPWIMEQTQCFQTIGRVQIHVLLPHDLALISYCDQPTTLTEGTIEDWKCVSKFETFPNCPNGAVRDVKKGHLYVFTNRNHLYRSTNPQ
ncbi:hypothetical protein M3Y94_00602000 [Aphelenchoides besseyi]|nr:hypothetical protein M3Y94_00602000 [Aphelenchoides besseyi]